VRVRRELVVLTGLARFCVRRRWWVIFAVWLPALLLSTATSALVGSNFRTDFSLPDSESLEAFRLLDDADPDRAGFTAQIVVRSESGFADPEIRATLGEMFEAVDEIEGVSVASPFDNLFQVNGNIAFARLDVSNRSQAELFELAAEIKALGVEAAALPGVQVEYGGDMFADFELPEAEILGLMRP
jgi:putative drug exporter of the RND superfamily